MGFDQVHHQTTRKSSSSSMDSNEDDQRHRPSSSSLYLQTQMNNSNSTSYQQVSPSINQSTYTTSTPSKRMKQLNNNNSTLLYSSSSAFSSPITNNSNVSTTSLLQSPYVISTPSPIVAYNQYMPSSNMMTMMNSGQILQTTNDMNNDKKQKTTGPIHNSKYKLKLCDKFLAEGKCPYNEKCQFAHGYEELNIWQEKRKAIATRLESQQQMMSNNGVTKRVSPSLSPSQGPSMALNQLNLLSPITPTLVTVDLNSNSNNATESVKPTGAAAVANPYVGNHIPHQQYEVPFTTAPLPQQLIGNNQQYLVSTNVSIESDPLIKSIIDLLESGELGTSDDIFDGASSRERLFSMDLTRDNSSPTDQYTPQMRPSTTRRNSGTILEHPQGNCAMSPSKDGDASSNIENVNIQNKPLFPIHQMSLEFSKE